MAIDHFYKCVKIVTASYLVDLFARLSNSYVSLVHGSTDNLSVTVSRTNSSQRVPFSPKTGILTRNSTKNLPSLRTYRGKSRENSTTLDF